MKVLDLQCSNRHVFEGWFASEADFSGQCERGLVECPICADADITKKLSAPRLNLGSARENATDESGPDAGNGRDVSLQTAWMRLARHVLANTEDVGESFATEARRIHHGEAPERGIRGKASAAETEALIGEGIAIVPLALPEALKRPLQ